MQDRRLGTIDIPPLGLGTWGIGGQVQRFGHQVSWGTIDHNDALRALQAGFDAGLRLVDTSDAYGAGRSERIISEAIQGRRDDIIVATKFGHMFDEASSTLFEDCWDPDYIRTACEGSLRRLGVECIDLYQFHISSAVDAGEQVREVLEELVAAGKIRWYGWSTDRVESFVQFVDSPNCVAVQQHINVAWDEYANLDLLRLAEKNHCASLARSPLGHGLYSGKYQVAGAAPKDFRSGWNLSDGEQANRLHQLAAVQDILQSDGRTVTQGALAWIWAMSPAAIPIPGFRNVEQVEGLVGALEHGPLTAAQMTEIDTLLGRNLYGAASAERPQFQ